MGLAISSEKDVWNAGDPTRCRSRLELILELMGPKPLIPKVLAERVGFASALLRLHPRHQLDRVIS